MLYPELASAALSANRTERELAYSMRNNQREARRRGSPSGGCPADGRAHVREALRTKRRHVRSRGVANAT